MARFNYKELLKTNSGLANIPTLAERDNLLDLLRFLNIIGSELDYQVIVTSGFRCDAVNKAVGGVTSSHHRLGFAADLTCRNIDHLVHCLKKHINDIDQLIYYRKKNFVHISLHPNNRKQYRER